MKKLLYGKHILLKISCAFLLTTITSTCFAITHKNSPADQRVSLGYFTPSSGGVGNVPLAYTTQDNGNTWQTSTFPALLPNEEFFFMSSVACDHTVTSCVAIGTTNLPPDYLNQPIGYRSQDGGNTWTRTSFSSFPYNVYTRGVTCDENGTYCVAIGNNDDTRQPNNAICYISTDGGSSWQLQAFLPMPADSGNYDNQPFAIACDKKVNHCVSVGHYYLPSFNSVPLGFVSNDRGVTWSLSNPIPVIDNSTYNPLYGLACDESAMNCVAVGWSKVGANRIDAYTTSNGGIDWLPATSLPLPNTDASYFNGVSCDSQAKNCVAVGYSISTGLESPLSYVTNNGGKTWIASATQPPRVPNALNHELYSVSCDKNLKKCTAVGFYYPSLLNSYPLSYVSTDGGNNWNISQQLPAMPANAAAATLYSMAGENPASASLNY